MLSVLSMNNQNFPATTDLLQQLRAASEGLLYISETESPLEVVHLQEVQDSSSLPATLINRTEMPEDTEIEIVELPYFFRNMTREEPEEGEGENQTARRYKELQEFLEQNLLEVKVYRLGKRRIQAYILGKAATGEYAGLKALLVET